jgi:ech hydrogenase subunit E
MGEECVTNVPFGPQHVVLPEPVHFDLHVQDEVVVGADFKLGFAHRGIEKAFEKRDIYSTPFVAERICGICSCSHSCAISGVLEKATGTVIPDNARYVRSLVLELDRIHSHLLILGHLGETMGFENLFMLTWRDREQVMDMLELITGNRVNHNVNTIGGVRRSVTSAMAKDMDKRIDDFAGKWNVLAEFYTKDQGFFRRTSGVGVIPKDIAWAAGVVGPNAREVFESIKMVKALLGMIDESKPFAVDKGPRMLPKDEVFFNIEAPRGELFYYIKGNGTNKCARMKVRTPTLATLRGVPVILPGMEIQHVPLTVISIDPCICCTER